MKAERIRISIGLILCFATFFAGELQAQNMALGKVLITATPILAQDADTAAFEAYFTNDVSPVWAERMPGTELHLFLADRGAERGQHLLAWTIHDPEQRASYPAPNDSSPFPAELLAATGVTSGPEAVTLGASYAEYVLVGADDLGELPHVDLLGMHYAQITPGCEKAFDSFVRDTIYPALGGRTPGMHLLYYKRTSGESPSNYIALFAIETLAAREAYFPTGGPETEALTAAFRPLEPVARALAEYQVEGTYLESDSGAAAAIFESRVWSDFVHIRAR